MVRIILSVSIVCLMVAPVIAQRSPGTPFEFVQRNDVRRELGFSEQQRELVGHLQPVCDAQCQARLSQMMTSLDTNTKTMFLALDDDLQQNALTELEQPIREQIETDALINNVLTEPQAQRFMQLRTQFRGLDSLLDERIGGALGLEQCQLDGLREVQRFGGELINACQSNPDLSPQQQLLGVQNINNVLIDQSINILNDAQIEIFVNLCGELCSFDPPEGDTDVPAELPNAPDTEPVPMGMESDNNPSQNPELGVVQNNPTAERQDRLSVTNRLRHRDFGSLPVTSRLTQDGRQRPAVAGSSTDRSNRSNANNASQGSGNRNRPSSRR